MPRDFKCCFKNILPRESLFWVWISILQICALFHIDPFLHLKQQNINQVKKCLGDNWGRYVFKLVGKVFVLYGHAQLPIFSVLLCSTVTQCMSVYVYNVWHSLVSRVCNELLHFQREYYSLYTLFSLIFESEEVGVLWIVEHENGMSKCFLISSC